MAVIFSNIPNSLTVGINPYAMPASLVVQYLSEGEHGIILTGYQLTNALRVKVQYALSWAIYYYIFGPALSTLEIQGSAFNRYCGTDIDGVYAILSFFANYNVGNSYLGFPKLTARIAVGPAIFYGALENQVVAADPRTPLIANFKLGFVGGFMV